MQGPLVYTLTLAETLTPELLLDAYANGLFPMAESAVSRELMWFCPEWRGILPLDAFHVSRSLAKAMRKHPFAITVNTAFPEVIGHCAHRIDGKDTWINAGIRRNYIELWRMGYAHSVECWQDNVLKGGLYGVSLGGAFFGESMFSHATNASKIALVTLVQRLQACGYVLLDVQFVTDHLKQFGAKEIPRGEYMTRLDAALAVKPSDFQ